MADPIVGRISVGDGATFTPRMEDLVLKWSNNKNLPNPPDFDFGTESGFNQVVHALTDIYNDAIEQGTIVAPAVDATLSIVGAAADAKAAGDRIRALESYPHFEYDDGELYLVY